MGALAGDEGGATLCEPAMPSKAVVLRPSEQPLADRGGGARTIPMVTPGCGSTQILNGFTMFEPGARIGLWRGAVFGPDIPAAEESQHPLDALMEARRQPRGYYLAAYRAGTWPKRLAKEAS